MIRKAITEDKSASSKLEPAYAMSDTGTECDSYINSNQKRGIKMTNPSTSLQKFEFNSNPLTVITDVTGEPWFIAKEIATILGYSDSEAMTRKLDDEEKSNRQIVGFGPNTGGKGVTVINESGLYSSILSSNKPEAKPFKKLVTSVVLPAIRKTGKYESNDRPVKQEKLNSKEYAATISATSKAMMSMAKAFGFKGNQAVLCADRATNQLVGVSPLKLLGADLVSESKTILLTPTEIGKEFGMSNRQVNQYLAEKGYQEQLANKWVLTAKGENYAEVLDTGKKQGDGTPVKQIKWRSSILDEMNARGSKSILLG